MGRCSPVDQEPGKTVKMSPPSSGPNAWMPGTDPVSEVNRPVAKQWTPVNTFAIASLAVSGFGLVFGFILAIPPVLGVIFGAVALNQVKTNPIERGRGVAWAGLLIGLVGSTWWIYFWADLIGHNFYGH